MGSTVTKDRAITKASFIKTFIDKLGDVAEWEHEGDVEDYGPGSKEKCICGHHIRYGYIIVNAKTSKKAQVGSECINHFKDYNTDLYNSLVNTITRIEKAEKEARELMLKEEVQNVMVPYQSKVQRIREAYVEIYGNHYCQDYAFYMAIKGRDAYRKTPKKDYTSLKCLLNWYIKQDSMITRFMEEKGIK